MSQQNGYVDADSTFAGLDSAEGFDRLPKLSAFPGQVFEVKVDEVKLEQAFKSGTTFVLEVEVVKSSTPTLAVGSKAAHTITDVDGRKNPANKGIKLNNVKKIMQALFPEVPANAADNQYQKLAAACVKQGLAKGRMARATVGQQGKTQSNQNFTPVFFDAIDGEG
jgi:hypothetical protein